MHVSCDGKNKTKSNEVIQTECHNRWQSTYFEKEVEPQERAAGNDGEPGSVPAGDGLGHVRGILDERRKALLSAGSASGLWGLDAGRNLVPQQLVHLLPLLPSLSCLRALQVLFPLPGLRTTQPGAGRSDPIVLLLRRPALQQGQFLGGPRAHAAEAMGT